ncbi:MAG TPA: efflux RND transporter periplasmic adaptor subunit [Flavobacterium sp.]|nr:efflux RND transporter periplasmic adaptor subunit [Flavobacterium sp.]HRZ74228.1 efflux RND transporter periplasmic adaptor subunit [Flavobacterium sp.]
MNALKLLSGCIISGIIVVFSSCTSKSDKTKTENQDSLKLVSVKSMVLKQEQVNQNIDYTATLIPFEEVHLAPASPGRIEKINVEISDNVTKGQIVALMDRTNLETARLNMMKLETDYKRLDTLKKTKSIADQQYDQIKSAYEIAKNSYQFLLDNTQLKAPFSGVVSGKYFEDGEIYSGTPVSSVGKPAIISIVQINQLKALVGISSNYFPLINVGMKANIKSELYPDMKFDGQIIKIYPTVDNVTKTFILEVVIQNANLKLRPGMFAKIQLNLGKGSAILVPSIALIKQTGTNDIYLFVNKNNVAIKTLVKTGKMFDDKIEILEGVNEGDEIIVVGQNKLENQTPISVIK